MFQILISGIISALLAIGGWVGYQEANLGGFSDPFLPIQGGTGISSTTPGDVGKVVKVLDDSPFTYELATDNGGAFPFTPTTNFGQLANATTTQIWLQGSPVSLSASSTAYFNDINIINATTTSLHVSSKVGIGTSTPAATLGVEGGGFFSGNLTAANITATGTLTVAATTTPNGGVLVSDNIRAYFGTDLESYATFDGTHLVINTRAQGGTGNLRVEGDTTPNTTNVYNIGANLRRFVYGYINQGLQILTDAFAFQIVNNSGTGLQFSSAGLADGFSFEVANAPTHVLSAGSNDDGAIWHLLRTTAPTNATSTGTMYSLTVDESYVWRMLNASTTMPHVAFKTRQTVSVTPASTISLNLIPYSDAFAVWTSSQDETITAPNTQIAGQELKLIIGNDGTLPRTITFSTGFDANGTIIGVTNATSTISFVSDGTNFQEFSREVGF